MIHRVVLPASGTLATARAQAIDMPQIMNADRGRKLPSKPNAAGEYNIELPLEPTNLKLVGGTVAQAQLAHCSAQGSACTSALSDHCDLLLSAGGTTGRATLHFAIVLDTGGETRERS
ncbi:hypothetical protein DFH06DRAFT_1199604 [Mycena polygramma]|nr:hypothetical protein DFH06DRAFT_1199604 [Mycena polygramma]